MLNLATLIAFLSLILFRVVIGYYPHSGQGDDHDFKAAYGGDYEAQRHWMELTLHVDIGKWYFYDLSYWGLDYPPLTAYVSYVCGYLSHYLVGPESVALFDSRGYEDSLHKSYMRATVLVLDVLLYFSAVYFIAKKLSIRYDREREQVFLWTTIVALAQPSIILIDHGHFQYNTTALGLSLWSFYFMTRRENGSFIYCVIGSILYCMALNFKQMTLYYAPVVFTYLLGRCVEFTDNNQKKISKGIFIKRFCVLGLTVILCFASLWWPFWVYTSDNVKAFDSVLQVLRRQFPFQRGLFEGKVSNIWCTLSTKPFSIRQRIPTSIQPLLALCLTVILLIPSCYSLFSKVYLIQGQYKAATQSEKYCELRMLLLCSHCSALSFFLASFQVHEKSILLALSPLSLLFMDFPYFVSWFSIATTWSMWPLVQVDKLHCAYIVCLVTFGSLVFMCNNNNIFPGSNSRPTPTLGQLHRFVQEYVIPLSSFAMLALHLIELSVGVHESLPDIFTVLFSIGGCGIFSVALIYSTAFLYS